MQPEPQMMTAGIGDVVPILFIVIALISGFLNFMKEKKTAEEVQDMRRRKRPPKNERDDELAQFLDEVATTDTKPKQRQRRKRPTQRDRSQERQKRRDENKQSEERPHRSPTRSSSVASRHLDTEEFSQVRDRHVESSVENRHLESQVSEQHLYETDEAATAETPATRQHRIAVLLKRPGGIRDAIMLNEVLQPPLSRRR
ncbi:MAG: hypothetical protein O2820_13065 [Planctomycetota bacterium]|nr:hypothetical protein [Planctomycetota bacterium]MDA1250143.1 hypothetical protein [Planctomycetota bacterium]